MQNSFIIYLRRWSDLSMAARLYLWHVAMLTFSLASVGLLFNLAVLALGYSRTDLGRINLVAVWASVVASVPLWWLATKIGLRAGLIIHAVLQSIAVALYAVAPSLPVLLVAAGLAGAASVLFQVSAPPLMMLYSSATTRDHLFSASEALTIGVSGLGSLFAGALPTICAWLLGVAPESGVAYQATFALAAVGVAVSLVPLLLGGRHWACHSTPVTAAPPAQAGTNLGAYNIASLLRQPLPLVALLIAPVLISLGAALLLPYLNLFFKQRFGVSDTLLGLIFALLNISTGLAVLLGPALSARLGKIKTVVITQLISIPFLLLMSFAPLLAVTVGAALVRAAMFNIGRPLYDAFAMERTVAPLRPIVIGVIGGASTVGYLVAPEISLGVQTEYGFAPLFLATTICYILATLALIVLFLRPARPAAYGWYNRTLGEGEQG